MSTLSPTDWMMLVLGVALLSAAVTALWGPRVQAAMAWRDARGVNDARPGRVSTSTGSTGSRPPMSEPTRLSVGVVLGVWGYHLAAWALPAGWVGLRIPVSLWPWVLGVGALWAGGSLLLDARDRRRTDRDPN